MRQLETRGLAALTRIVGEERAEDLAGVYRDRLLPPVESVTYRLSERGRESRRRLEQLHDRYLGERCFIIGNGPSLARTDISRLRHEVTFALNRGYLLFDRIGGPTTFLVAINRHVVEQFGQDLVDAGPPVFVGWRSRGEVPRRGDVVFVRRAPRYTFSRNIAEDGASEGPTVTYMAMQLAYHMGFTEVILTGVDHSFSTAGPPNKLVTSTGADANHFDPNYFGAGVRWQLPDLEMSEVVYRLARERFEASDRRIVDATVDGNLRVYPRVDFDQVTSATR